MELVLDPLDWSVNLELRTNTFSDDEVEELNRLLFVDEVEKTSQLVEPMEVEDVRPLEIRIAELLELAKKHITPFPCEHSNLPDSVIDLTGE